MAGLLSGDIATRIYNGFKGKLLKGTLKRIAPAPAAGKNAKGDPLGTTVTTWPCQGFVDEYSEYYRAQAGIPDTDSKVCVFAKSLPANVRPQKDDLVQFEHPTGVDPWYQLREPRTDPATALWECRAFKTQDSGISS